MTSYVHCMSGVWITSFALCVLPYNLGLYVILIRVPSAPAGGSSPDDGVTVNCSSELGAKKASNGRPCLKKEKTPIGWHHISNVKLNSHLRSYQ